MKNLFMGQCTSCSAQRPNLSSSLPQTPEYELNPDAVFRVPLSSTSTSTARAPNSGKIHPALKIRSKIKKSATRTTVTAPQPQEKGTEDGSMNAVDASDTRNTYQRKPSKKHRVSPSPQTTADSTGHKGGFFLWNKSAGKSEQPDVKSSPPKKVFLRKFLFLRNTPTFQAKPDGDNSTSNNNEASPAGDNNNTDSSLTASSKVANVTTNQEKDFAESFGSEGPIPISAVTLHALNSNRENKKQLRDLFLFGTTDTTTSTTTTVTNSTSAPAAGYFSLPLFIAASEMESKRSGGGASARGSPSPSLPLHAASQLPPEKVKRTFQYQPPKSAISAKIAALNLNQAPRAALTGTGSTQLPAHSRFQAVCNTNLNRYGENTRLFGRPGNQIFRTYPNLVPSPSTRATATAAATNPSTLVPISELNNNRSDGSTSPSLCNPPRSTYTTLKKPVEPRHFHTILYPARTQAQNQNLQSVPNLGVKGLQTSTVNQGVVLQRKMFNQGGKGDDKSTPTSAKCKSGGCSSGSVKKATEGRHANAKMNYPLQHDSSSSGEFGSKLGHHHHRGGGDHHHMSDSEYLDDEISDQPDLTLTFKDLSPSSSGESLASCDLMLEKRVNREESFQRDGDMASDSAFSDTSSAKAVPTSAAALARLSSIDRLSSPKHRLRSSGPPLSPKAPSPSKPKPKQNFILRNLQQVSSASPKDRKDANGSGKKMSLKEVRSDATATSELPKEPKTLSVSPAKAKAPEPMPAEKSPKRMPEPVIKDAVRASLEEKLPEEAKESVLKSMMDDMEYLRTQLLVLKEELEERERADADKDRTIEKLMLEIDVLKRNNNDRKGSEVGGAERVHKLHLDCEPPTANAAAQTDSDTISPLRGISYDECEKFGELVSFRIGRRISPSSSSVSGKSPDVSLE